MIALIDSSSPEGILSLLPLIALLLAPARPAGVYFEQRTYAREDGAAPGPGVLSRVWFAGSRMRMEAGDAPGGPALVLRLDTGQAYRIEPERKVALEIDPARLRARAHMDASVAGDLMGGSEEGSARTSSLPAGKTVAGYPCRGYRIKAPSLVMDVFVTDALPLTVDAFADFLEWSGASQSLGGLIQEIRRLPGFPMETHTRVTVLGQVRETVSTVTKVKVGPHPAAVFEVPSGYRIEKEAANQED
jgi:hypothetical protein